MKIEFNYIDASSMEEELNKFKTFKERYLNIATGRRKVNDDDLELERIAVVLETEQILENLSELLKNQIAEEKEDAPERDETIKNLRIRIDQLQDKVLEAQSELFELRKEKNEKKEVIKLRICRE